MEELNYDDYFNEIFKEIKVEELTFEETLRELIEKRENLNQEEKDFKVKWKQEIRMKKLNNIFDE